MCAEKLVQQAAALSEAGDRDGALAANRKAVQLYRHLMRVSPIHYRPPSPLRFRTCRSLCSRPATGGRPQRVMDVITMPRHLAPNNARNITNLEESLRILSRFETATEVANSNTAQSSVR